MIDNSNIKDTSKNVRNILIIGRTGSGKSTLANVLAETDNFKEGGTSLPETEKFQAEEFEDEGIKYRIFDTVGFGSKGIDEVLKELFKIENYIKNGGLNQILFVYKSRLNTEIEYYDLLKRVVFEDDIGKYTTIVRTNFVDFQCDEKCEADERKCIEEFKEEIGNCKIIHVENPPINKKKAEHYRKKSRTKILKFLKNSQEIYKVNFLVGFRDALNNFDSIAKGATREVYRNLVIVNMLKKELDKFIPERKETMDRIKESKESVNKLRQNEKYRNMVHAISSFIEISGITLKKREPNGTLYLLVVSPPPPFKAISSNMFSSISVGLYNQKIEGDEFKKLRAYFENDNEKANRILKLWKVLIESNKSIKSIYDDFKDSEYNKKVFNEKKIKIIENLLSEILIDTRIKNELENDANKVRKEIFNYEPSNIESYLRPTPLLLGYIIMDHLYGYKDNAQVFFDIDEVTEYLKKDLDKWEEKRDKILDEQIIICEKSKKKLEPLKLIDSELKEKIKIDENALRKNFDDITLAKI
ncbi:hypothetical protein RhiirA5_454578 [Rhizophagus irregularis]|uniref:AIG1-type G domain-containing protein n=1 Tax=Rhizophagus irregularis TaxID=588596 RepID=A0A2N0P5U2_9GLOM|nr:hypothetical protein RhiirA5_454578 [Rhizophagus irregularis]